MLRSDSIFRGACAAVLCGVMAGQPLFSEGMKAVPAAAPATQIQGIDRVRYALSRFTFGARPGELEAVERQGLSKWFDEQLNPSRLDDSGVLSRLEAYPAMKLSTAQLMKRFPSPQMIRVMERTGAPLPSDPVEHAIYAQQIALYDAKLNAQNSKPDQTASMMQPEMTADGTDGAKGKRFEKLQAAGVQPGQAQREVRELMQLDPQARFDRIIHMNISELVALRGAMGPQRLPMLTEGMTAEQKESLAALGGGPRVVGAELMQQRLVREIYSSHQLEEVMTSFWMNHFNVYIRKNAQEPYYLPSYERDVVRPRALGNFEDLLVAVAKSPAMLVYLDNFQSTGPRSDAATRQPLFQRVAQQKRPTGLNENYARELMELHTLGVNGGYTQKDVTEVAKVFTGWTLDAGYKPGKQAGRRFVMGGLQEVAMNAAQASSFQFNERRHEPGEKSVLGKTISEGGEREGLEVLHMLATSPATAHFISEKLAVRFVSDHPDAKLVDRMAASFEKTRGDIKAVLKTMFDAPEFWAKANEGAKFKTPEEFVVSAVRATGAEVTNPLSLVQSMNSLGMPLYGAQPPTGYKWDQETWLNTSALVSRMNFGIQLGHSSMMGVVVNAPAGLAGKQDEAREQDLEYGLLGRPASMGTRKTVMDQFRNSDLQSQAENGFKPKGDDGEEMTADAPKMARPKMTRQASNMDSQTANMIGLLIGSPDFQRR